MTETEEIKTLLANTTPRESIKRLCELLAEARASKVRVENALLEVRELLKERDPALFQEVDQIIRGSYVFNQDFTPERINLTPKRRDGY